MPDRAKNMGDGWETRRRRGPGYDWAIVRLGATGTVSKVEIDTNHYKGNYPDRASLDGCLAPGASPDQLRAAAWSVILPETKLSANKRHFFSGKQLQPAAPCRTCGSIFFRTAASAACASMARSHEIDAATPEARARLLRARAERRAGSIG